MKAVPSGAAVGAAPCPPPRIVSLSAILWNGDGVSLDQQKVSAPKPEERWGEKRA